MHPRLSIQGKTLKAESPHAVRPLPVRILAILPHAHVLTLALLPLALLVLDRNWIFSGPDRDAWIYYGYYENAIHYLREFPDAYYSSRLAVFLPGFLLHHLLRPVTANVVLHLALTMTAVVCFYRVARDLGGTRVALLAAIAFACHPLLLHALGWNYVDGFGITYFLVALSLVAAAAQSSRHPWLLLGGAGAVLTALISSNLFYGIYAPVLVGHWSALDERRDWCRLVRSVTAIALGAAGAGFVLSVVSWLAGGPFHFLRPSFGFLSNTLETKNPFRDPTYDWLSDAVWLAVPVAALLGSIVVLWTLRRRGDHERRRLLGWSQVPLVYLAGMLLLFQTIGDTAVLQHFYYASLLIPCAFLALAGQLAVVLPVLDRRSFNGLAVMVALTQLVPVAIPLISVASPATGYKWAPAFWALVACLGAVRMAYLGRRTQRSVYVFFASLGLAQLLIWQTAPATRSFDAYDGDGPGLFRQMTHTVTTLEEFDPSEQVRIWYDVEDRHGVVFDAVASAFLLCPRMINLSFPDLSTRRMCDGKQLGPQMSIVILSTDPEAFARAERTLRDLGLSAQLLGREEIPGPLPGYALTFVRTAAPGGV